MSGVEFDLVKLKQLGGIEVRDAIKHFASYEEYFLKLSGFVKESKYYLKAYTSDMVMSNGEEHKAFCEDLKMIRNDLMLLGITYPIPTLAEIAYEAEHGNRKSLEDWIDKFHVEIAKIAQSVSLAEVTGNNVPVERTADAIEEKPLILAADDKPELLTTVVSMLEDRFKVMAVTSGKTALRAIERHSPELFLLDIEMPEMDGYELAELIREQARFAQTPIIFLTSKNTREDVIVAIQRGGSDYLVKPVNKELLLSKILQHLGRV